MLNFGGVYHILFIIHYILYIIYYILYIIYHIFIALHVTIKNKPFM